MHTRPPHLSLPRSVNAKTKTQKHTVTHRHGNIVTQKLTPLGRTLESFPYVNSSALCDVRSHMSLTWLPHQVLSLAQVPSVWFLSVLSLSVLSLSPSLFICLSIYP